MSFLSAFFSLLSTCNVETRSPSCQIFLVSGISPSLLRLYDCYPRWLQKLTHFLTSGLSPSNVSDPANTNLTMSHCHLKIPALTPHYLKDKAPASFLACCDQPAVCDLARLLSAVPSLINPYLAPCASTTKKSSQLLWAALFFFASMPLFIMSSLNCPSIPSPWPGQHLLSFKA